jgi:hypothetical protein
MRLHLIEGLIPIKRRCKDTKKIWIKQIFCVLFYTYFKKVQLWYNLGTCLDNMYLMGSPLYIGIPDVLGTRYMLWHKRDETEIKKQKLSFWSTKGALLMSERCPFGVQNLSFWITLFTFLKQQTSNTGVLNIVENARFIILFINFFLWKTGLTAGHSLLKQSLHLTF